MDNLKKNYIVLISKENEKFKLLINHANKFETLKNIIDDYRENCEDDEDEEEIIIPLTNIESNIIKKTIEFTENNSDKPNTFTNLEKINLNSNPLSNYNKRLFEYDLETLYSMITTANFLKNDYMLNVLCKVIADMIKEQSSKDIKKIYSIHGDFSEKEKCEIISKYPFLK